MVLAADTATTVAIFTGVYVVMVLLAWIFSPRDVQGRRRAYGCAVFLVIFFGLFVAAFAAWAAHHIF